MNLRFLIICATSINGNRDWNKQVSEKWGKKPPDFKMKCFCLKPCDLFMIFHDIKYTKKERKPCSKGTSAIYLNNFFPFVLYPLSLSARWRYDVFYRYLHFLLLLYIPFICARGLVVLFVEKFHTISCQRLNQKKWDKSEKLTVNYCNSFIFED